MTQSPHLPQDPVPMLTDRLSKRLANFKLSDAVIKGIADRVVIDGLSIARFNPCIYGICVDYFTDKLPNLDLLNPKRSATRCSMCRSRNSAVTERSPRRSSRRCSIAELMLPCIV